MMFIFSLKMFIRNLIANRSYHLVNIAGLYIGLTGSILLGMYVQEELTYDQHFLGFDRIYRVVGERIVSNDSNIAAPVSPLLGSFLTQDFPIVESFVRFTPEDRSVFQSEDVSAFWDDIYLADSNVFSMFSHNILFGDPSSALNAPSSIAISQRFANFYFGSSSPIGRTVSKNGIDLTVTLVFSDLPKNTHLKYDVLLGRDPRIDEVLRGSARGLALAAYWHTDYTYIRLPQDFNVEAFSEISDTLFKSRLESVVKRFNAVFRYYVEPLSEIHLNSVTEEDLPRSNKFYVFACIAMAILLLATSYANYVVLTSAYINRNKKKTAILRALGASNRQLLVHYLIEPVILMLTALGLAFVSIYIFLEFFPGYRFSNGDSGILIERNFANIGLIIVSITLLGAVAGLTPIFSMLRTNIATALRGVALAVTSKTSSVKYLVLCQYAASLMFMFTTYSMNGQFNYMSDRPIGFDKNNKIVVQITGADAIENIPNFVSEISGNVGILNESLSESVPGDILNTMEWRTENEDGVSEFRTGYRNLVDANYFDTLGIPITRGRMFEYTDTSEDKIVFINEAFVRMMAWEEPIGRIIAGRTVVGVVEDFHFHGINQPVGPMVFEIYPLEYANLNYAQRQNMNATLTMSLSGNSVSNTLEYLQLQWQRHFPAQPFEYVFLDQKLMSLNSSDYTQMRVLAVFGVLSALIASFGIYAHTAFAIEQGTKDIGIRRILGASVFQIIALLSKRLIVLVLVAAFIATCVSYWVVSNWLSNFQFRGDVDLLGYSAITFLVIVSSLAIVSTLIFSISYRNPILSIRQE